MDTITIYLAGEIHSDWRERIREELTKRDLPVRFVGPQEVHDRSDDIGEAILGKQPDDRYRDLMGQEPIPSGLESSSGRQTSSSLTSARNTGSGIPRPMQVQPSPQGYHSYS